VAQAQAIAQAHQLTNQNGAEAYDAES